MFKFKRDIKLFLFGNFLFGFGLTGFILLFNLFMKAMGFGEGTIGALLAYRTYAIMILTIPAALIARRSILKPLFLVTVVFSSLGYTIPLLTRNINEMIFRCSNRRSFRIILRCDSWTFYNAYK